MGHRVHADHFSEDIKSVVQDDKNCVQERYVQYMQGADKIQPHIDLWRYSRFGQKHGSKMSNGRSMTWKQNF